MNDQVNLYIRLETPNNEYEAGKLVFESSLNKSLNFRVFTCNHEFTQFKDKVYLEASVEMSDLKKWLVNRLQLRVLGKSEDVIRAFEDKVVMLTGYRVEEYGNLDAVTAWNSLNKLVLRPLPYGSVWTDNKYLPTPRHEREGFECNHRDNKWVFKEASGWSEPIFEVFIDEYGRPIFRFRPDSDGWPATMECLLSDLEEFLFENRNSTGEWLINSVFTERDS